MRVEMGREVRPPNIDEKWHFFTLFGLRCSYSIVPRTYLLARFASLSNDKEFQKR
jgi:hypothetical protein